MRIRNILYGVAVASMLGGCASQALADEAPAAAPFASPTASPAASPAGWVEPDSYTFTLASSCGSPIGRFTSTVVNGLVTGSEGLDAAARKALMAHLSRIVPTLGELEARATTAKKAGTDVVIESDPADGHPTSITIGDDRCYQVSDYSVG